MRKGEFISVVQDPIILKSEDIPAIQNILREFPYFSTAHSLLAKAYYEGEHISFQPQLRKAAAYALDRNRLHELLYAEVAITPLDEIAKPLEEEVVLQETKEEKPLIEETKTVEDLEEKTADSESDHQEEKEIVKEKEEIDLLELQILNSAISNSIIQEVSELDDELPLIEKEPIVEFEEEPEITEHFDDSSFHSFTDWLSFYSDNPEKEESKTSLWKNTTDLSAQAKRDFGFPKQKEKQEFYSALKMAKLSVQEDDDLVTETLAKIYAAQENYEKAIKAYKKLQLKYPEKKVYFASQINALKNNLK